MKCEFPNAAHGMRDTPLRLLIKMFPDLAKKVFDQCMETNLQQYADRDSGNGSAGDNKDKYHEHQGNINMLKNTIDRFLLQ